MNMKQVYACKDSLTIWVDIYNLQNLVIREDKDKMQDGYLVHKKGLHKIGPNHPKSRVGPEGASYTLR